MVLNGSQLCSYRNFNALCIINYTIHNTDMLINDYTLSVLSFANCNYELLNHEFKRYCKSNDYAYTFTEFALMDKKSSVIVVSV